MYLRRLLLLLLKYISKKKQIKDIFWFGDFNNWNDAKSQSCGYDDENILLTCKESLLKVRNGKYKYERDSVLFSEVQYSWGLLTGLLKCALDHNGRLSIIDFGGSLGSSYFQNHSFFCEKSMEWLIVEQNMFVETGKQYFQNNNLKFYYSIDECLVYHKPNSILFSSVLQYLNHFDEIIEHANSLRLPYIIIDRTAFANNGESRIVIQNVPETIYKASYPMHVFDYKNLISMFTNYEVLLDFDSQCDPKRILEDGYQIIWKGLILKLKT
jgi:putative methyltransferase (TIGR04325 family)